MKCNRCGRKDSPLFIDPRLNHRKFVNGYVYINTTVCAKCEKEVLANQEKYRRSARYQYQIAKDWARHNM
jgi:hypothetical protein